MRTLITTGLLLGLLTSASVVGAAPSYPGPNLISVLTTNDSHTVDETGQIIHTWHGAAPLAAITYLLPDWSILRPCFDSTGAFPTGRIVLNPGGLPAPLL